MNMNNEQLRKIDELIATKIMGWQKEATLPEYFFWKDVKNGELKYHIDDWKPSTKIKYAWEVFERIEKKFSWVQLEKHFRYRCQIINWNRETRDYEFIAQVDAETAPLAICLAALKAAEIEIEMEESNNE